jgi:hypothetical protein
VQVIRRRDHGTTRTTRRPASEKRQGTKSRAVVRRLGSERYGDLSLAPAVMTGAILRQDDLDACAQGCLQEYNDRFGSGLDVMRR